MLSLLEIFMGIKNISFTKLERDTHIPNRRLHEIAWEKAIPSDEEVKKIVKALGVKVEDIWNGDEIESQVQRLVV